MRSFVTVSPSYNTSLLHTLSLSPSLVYCRNILIHLLSWESTVQKKIETFLCHYHVSYHDIIQLLLNRSSCNVYRCNEWCTFTSLVFTCTLVQNLCNWKLLKVHTMLTSCFPQKLRKSSSPSIENWPFLVLTFRLFNQESTIWWNN